MNILEKPNEKNQAEKHKERETRIVAVAPSVWRSKRDVRAKARLPSWTLKGDLESKIVTLQALATNALKQCQKR